MKIDEAKEREAFYKWADAYGLRDEPNYCQLTEADCYAAWLARAAQPVTVTREALRQALRSTYSPDVSHEDSVESAMSALGIEVQP